MSELLPFTNAALQATIDQTAANGGGVVEVAAGIYQLSDAIHLRSGVRIVGEKGTIFRKNPSVSSVISDYLGYGHYEVMVEEPEKFEVGMGIFVSDHTANYFFSTTATILEKRGNALIIDRMLNSDIYPDNEATASTLFSLVSCIDIHDASIENIVLEGDIDETLILNGCRGGGVFLLNSQRVRIENIEVRHFNGDAISFQQCIDVAVKGCDLHHNQGSGLHPGSGSVRYVFERNHVHQNTSTGLFYCLRTSHSRCENNLFEDNGGAGISIGERDTNHLIRGNTIRGNGGAGVLFRQPLRNGGDMVRLEHNQIGPNCTHSSHVGAEIVIGSGLRDIYCAS